MISAWETSFGEEEIEHVVGSLRNKHVSQGKVTEEFEGLLSSYLHVENVVAVSSGTSALTIALMSLGVGPGDEVILPNRTWIATAHAVHILGAKVVLVDVEDGRPIIDVSQIEKKITPRTRVIMPVHMNGRSADMREITRIAKKHKLAVVEDAAQAIASQNPYGFLGTQSDIGCFSLSVAKTISTGQGGFTVTNNKELGDRMRAIRTHGLERVKDPSNWVMPGFNFRFTDILASIGIEQLKRLPERIKQLRDIYITYRQGLENSQFQLIPVNLDAGEVPVYNEFLIDNRGQWVDRLESIGIETRPFYPDLSNAPYLQQTEETFPNSERYCKNGIYLPSGPSQQLSSINMCIKDINSLSLQ